MNKIKLLILFSFIYTACVTAQGLKFEQINTDQGLSNSLVNTIIQDKQGFIWLGTESGLNKYDGCNFKVFNSDPDNLFSIRASGVKNIFEDHTGLLWLSFSTGGLSYYNPKTEKFYNFIEKTNISSGLSDNTVNVIFEDKKGNVWIGTNKGLNRFVRENNSFHYYFTSKGKKQHTGDQVNAIYQDKQNNLWIGSDHGLFTYDYKKDNFKTYSFPKGLSNETLVISTILQDYRGTYWFGTKGHGLFYANSLPQKPVYFKLFPEKSIFDVDHVLTCSNGDIWIAHSHGLSVIKQLDTPAFKVINFFDSPGYKDLNGHLHIHFLKEDRQGNIWVTLDGINSDLFKINKNLKLESLSDYQSYYSIAKNKKATCILQDKFDVIWIGLAKGGIAKCDLHGKPFEKISLTSLNGSNAHSDVVYSIFEDPVSGVWLGTSQGLVNLSAKGDYLKTYTYAYGCKNCPPGMEVATISRDKSGYLWLGFYDSQISRFNPRTGEFKNYLYNPTKKFSNVGWAVRQIIPDYRGYLWFASFSAGLSKVKSAADTFFNYSNGTLPWKNAYVKNNPGSNISSNKINCMLPEKDGVIWIGTINEGLDKFDIKSSTFENFKMQVGKAGSISSNEINFLYRDSKKQLWIGTGGGLCLMDEKAKMFKHFSTNNGLCNNEVVGITEDSKGLLWISTMHGISCFNSITNTFKNFYKEDGLQSNEFNIGAVMKAVNGKLYFGGNNGVSVITPDSIVNNPYKPDVVIREMRIFNRVIHASDTINKRVILPLAINYTDKLSLKNYENDFVLEFSALHYSSPLKNELKYKLEGYDNEWKTTRFPNNNATYTGLPPGNYRFKVIGSNNDGLWNDKGASLEIIILPPWYNTWWFRLLCIFFLTSIILTAYILRIRNLKKWQKLLEKKIEIRTNHLEKANKILEKQKHEISLQNTEINAQKYEIMDISERLHKADSLKINFFTNVSHEFRTPLTIISGVLSKIKQAALPGTFFTPDDYGMIERNTSRLLKLINQLLDFRKIDQSAYRLKLEMTDITEFAGNIIAEFSPMSIKASIKLIYQKPEGPVVGFIDRDIVEKILFNLLSNAIKYTPDGGEINCLMSFDHNTISIAINDTGIGISPEDISNLFNRFFEAGKKKFQRYESSGLGLAFVKELANIHQGDISVASVEGKGSTFTVTLPIMQQSIELNGIYNDEILIDNHYSSSLLEGVENNFNEITGVIKKNGKPLLIIAEDSADLRFLIKQEMEHEYNVIACSDGLLAWEQICSTPPDAVLSDVMMPGMSGIELCCNIKTLETTSHVPVILLTARTSEENIIEGLEQGADDYISKPFNINILKARLRNIITQRKKLRAQFIEEPEKDILKLATNNTDKEFIERLVNVIESEIDNQDLNSNYLVKALGMSKSSLYKKVNALAGVSINIFVRNYRLKKSLEMIKTGNSNIAETAYQLGFSSPNYFSTCFSEYFGFPPSKINK